MKRFDEHLGMIVEDELQSPVFKAHYETPALRRSALARMKEWINRIVKPSAPTSRKS